MLGPLRTRSRPDYYPRTRVVLIIVGTALVTWTLVEVARGRTNPLEWSIITTSGFLFSAFIIYLGIWCFVPWRAILDEEGIELTHGPSKRRLSWETIVQMTLCALDEDGGKVNGITFRSSKKNVDLGVEFRREDLREIAGLARNRLERKGIRIVDAPNLDALYEMMDRDPALKP